MNFYDQFRIEVDAWRGGSDAILCCGAPGCTTSENIPDGTTLADLENIADNHQKAYHPELIPVPIDF